jgi:riboflavin synthase
MFTGLIESVGRVAGVDHHASGLGIHIETTLASELKAGDSIAVNGVCLTVTGVDDRTFSADIGPETARVTTLGGFAPGRPVNLERAMRGDGRFGGHFVQGHIDATGTLERVREEGDAHWMTIACPTEFAPYLVTRGSVAVDGVSLTVAHLAGSSFDVMIIPFTWQHTSLSSLTPGAPVNVECDLVGKYVARAVAMYRT